MDSNVATVTINLVPPFATFTQGGWGSRPRAGNPGAFLAVNFADVSSASGGVTIGAGTKTLHFDGAVNVEAFLPTGGKPAVLTAAANNPTNSKGGVFAGQVLALRLNVDFSNEGKTRVGFGTLHLAKGSLSGQTVAQVLALANNVLGGTALPPSGVTISDLSDILAKINANYDGGKEDDGYLVP